MSVGERADFQLEAYPMDWNGASKDCSWLSTNDSASLTNGFYTYTLQIITLSTDLVLDGCDLHLNGTKFSVNSSATNSPTITLRNGANIHLTGGVASGGVDLSKPIIIKINWFASGASSAVRLFLLPTIQDL